VPFGVIFIRRELADFCHLERVRCGHVVAKETRSAGPVLRFCDQGLENAYIDRLFSEALVKFPRSEIIWIVTLLMSGMLSAQTAPQKVIIDTDIGDDIDDAFALALAVTSPELQVLGVTTTFGDTETRAKIADRFLGEVGRADIPVFAGKATPPRNTMSQRKYAGGGKFAKPSHGDAVQFMLDEVRKYPGAITLLAIGPLMNVGAAIDRDPDTFRKLRRVVLMGGSIRRGYGDLGYTDPVPPMAEWNIMNDVASAQKLFTVGVPLFVMPLDSTQLKLDEVKRAFLFSRGTAVTDQLAILYHLWGQETPTLFDAMTVVFALRADLCPVQGMRIQVDEKGFTREEPGPPNAQVCLNSNSEDFFRFYLKELAQNGTVQ
jgi:purine nucleosidase